MATVRGARTWHPALTAGGPEWRLDYRCPACRQQHAINLQPGTEATQLWCHACGQGADVTLTA